VTEHVVEWGVEECILDLDERASCGICTVKSLKQTAEQQQVSQKTVQEWWNEARFDTSRHEIAFFDRSHPLVFCNNIVIYSANNTTYIYIYIYLLTYSMEQSPS
jgi:hypothetical protein